MQVYQAPIRRGGKLELISEYEGLDDSSSHSICGNRGSEQNSADTTAKAPIPVVFYGQHYDALLDKNLNPAHRSQL